MKIATYVLLIISIFFSSCSNSVDDDLDDSMNFLKVKVGGVERTFTDVSARWIEGGNFLEIVASATGPESLSIVVQSEVSRVPIGEYALDDNSIYTIVSAYSSTENNIQQNFAATRGTVSAFDAFNLKINGLNERVVEGTFSGSLVSVSGLETLATLSLEEGAFYVNMRAE